MVEIGFPEQDRLDAAVRYASVRFEEFSLGANPAYYNGVDGIRIKGEELAGFESRVDSLHHLLRRRKVGADQNVEMLVSLCHVVFSIY